MQCKLGMRYSDSTRWLMALVAGMVISTSASLPAHAELKGKALKIHRELIRQTPIFEEPKLQEYIDNLGQKILAHSEHAGREYHFFLLDNPMPDAKTPGYGLIYISRGLLTVLNSEAELAGVIAHEIGHNVGNHSERFKARRNLTGFGAFLASLLTGNTGIGNSVNVANQKGMFEFRRENELEADALAAKYLFAANYEPEGIVDALSQLADFNSFMARIAGGGPVYHGIQATHPRDDIRRRKGIREAGTLPPGEALIGRDEYREMVDGMLFGENYTGNTPKGYERFSHKGLGITFLYPKDWSQVTKGSKIILKDPEKSVQLKLTVEKTADKTKSSEEILTAKYPENLNDTRPIKKHKTKDLGTTARHQQQRVAAVTIGRNTFHFDGIARNNQLTEEQDQQFVQIIETFRRAVRSDFPPESLQTITYKRFEPGDTFADLAKDKELGELTEQYLRLINGYYPKGQPEPGTWVKVIRTGPPPKQQVAKQAE